MPGPSRYDGRVPRDALFLGLDFGTESVRAVLVSRDGRTSGQAVAPYRHGQIVPDSPAALELFGAPLPASFALQHPLDWVESAGEAARAALSGAAAPPASIAGVGVDFTSCTMLPCRADGTPLCLAPGALTGTPGAVSRDPHAWPKLWKHHGALTQTDRLNRVARDRAEPWLARYGGVIGLEWLFPKMLEVIERSPRAAEAADTWLEAGDWLVWQLIGSAATGGAIDASGPPRSTCQAGYKGLWSARDGFPSRDYLAAVHPALAEHVGRRLPGRFIAPGRAAGSLSPWAAERLGLRAGIAVSAAVIDAHAGVPGAGVAQPGTLVMVLGTSGCHMLLSEHERLIPGVAGVVKDGILPGLYGYETGQASMGDAFDLVRRLSGHADFAALDALAARVPAGADGVLALDWFNGCRTPLMDGSLTGALVGLTLATRAEQVYRAVLEASAAGLRWVVDTLREGGVRVDRFVATGGLASRNPLLAHIVASTLGAPIAVHAAPHGSAQGAAILAALAAGSAGGGFDDAGEAVECMAGRRSVLPPPRVLEPDPGSARVYDRLYSAYRRFAADMARADSVLRSPLMDAERGPVA